MPLTQQFKYQVQQFVRESGYWALVLTVFVVIRFGGSADTFPGVRVVYDHPTFGNLLIYSIIGGFLLGSILSIVRMFILNEWLKSKSFGRIIFYETLVSLLVFVSMILLMMLISFMNLGYNILEFPEFLGHYLKTSSVFILTGFFFFSTVQFSLFLQADKKLGLGVLTNLLRGKYYLPKEEERVFMFLDMTDSTANAENLGHLRYSKLLQDCFRLLTDLIIEFRGEIYQFVGDEVVVTWESEKGFEHNNSLRFFFAYKDILEANKAFFMKNFGLIPSFKAALHSGKVSVAEVGEINTQIAYHGDVLNTTSRIQELCSKFSAQLLASEAYMAQLQEDDVKYQEEAVEISLRGKQVPVNIYNLDTEICLLPTIDNR